MRAACAGVSVTSCALALVSLETVARAVSPLVAVFAASLEHADSATHAKTGTRQNAAAPTPRGNARSKVWLNVVWQVMDFSAFQFERVVWRRRARGRRGHC